ncbi:unnamed protein product [Ixodes pacificus]
MFHGLLLGLFFGGGCCCTSTAVTTVTPEEAGSEFETLGSILGHGWTSSFLNEQAGHYPLSLLQMQQLKSKHHYDRPFSKVHRATLMVTIFWGTNHTIGSDPSPNVDAALAFNKRRAEFTPNADATLVSDACSEYMIRQWRTGDGTDV